MDWITKLIIWPSSACAFRHSQQEDSKCVSAAVLEVLGCSEISCCVAFAFLLSVQRLCNCPLFHLTGAVWMLRLKFAAQQLKVQETMGQ